MGRHPRRMVSRCCPTFLYPSARFSLMQMRLIPTHSKKIKLITSERLLRCVASLGCGWVETRVRLCRTLPPTFRSDSPVKVSNYDAMDWIATPDFGFHNDRPLPDYPRPMDGKWPPTSKITVRYIAPWGGFRPGRSTGNTDFCI